MILSKWGELEGRMCRSPHALHGPHARATCDGHCHVLELVQPSMQNNMQNMQNMQTRFQYAKYAHHDPMMLME
jgi:hypothetical protein